MNERTAGTCLHISVASDKPSNGEYLTYLNMYSARNHLEFALQARPQIIFDPDEPDWSVTLKSANGKWMYTLCYEPRKEKPHRVSVTTWCEEMWAHDASYELQAEEWIYTPGIQVDWATMSNGEDPTPMDHVCKESLRTK